MPAEGKPSRRRRECRGAILRSILALTLLGLAGCSTLQSKVTWQGEDGKVGDTVQAIFEGNESVSRFTLFRKIEDLLYDFSKDTSRESAIYDAALAIEDFYRTQGFPRIDVGYEIGEPPAEGARQVSFKIQEGGLVVVEELEIRGNHSIQDDELLKLLPQVSSGALGFGRPIFVQAVLEGFANDIQTRFAQDGYLDCKVATPEVTYIEDGKAVRVLIQVQEGPIFTLHEVQVAPELLEAAEGWTPGELAGEPFGRELTAQLQLGLRQTLRRLGYPKPKVLAFRQAGDRRRAEQPSRSDRAWRDRTRAP